MTTSDFCNFEFLVSRIKQNFFGGEVPCFSYKNRNFENFQKNGIYVRELVIFNYMEIF